MRHGFLMVKATLLLVMKKVGGGELWMSFAIVERQMYASHTRHGIGQQRRSGTLQQGNADKTKEKNSGLWREKKTTSFY